MPRESTFIDYVCSHINRFDLQKTNLQVVLPSLRLGRVLSRRFTALAKKDNRLPCWLPKFVTIDQVISSFSGLGKAEPVELLALLYLSYEESCKAEGTPARSLDRFWEWGRMLISDFNQIDNQLAPAKEILQYLADEKSIGSWHLDLGSSQGKLQSAYLAFYNLLLPLYERFCQKLKQENLAYTGLAGRTACEKLPQLLQHNALPDDTFYLFAGFNALTKAEEQIIRTLIRAKKAEIIWNADRYYLDDPLQEAGLFLRRYRQDSDLNRFLKDEDIADNIKKLHINLVECAQRSAQAKWAAQWFGKEKDVAGCALVLNDESLFAPVMNALPDTLPFNATIAAPLSGTFSANLLAQLVEIRRFMQQNGSKSIKAGQFVQLLRNPLLELLAKDKKNLHKKESDILDSHRSYYSVQEWIELFAENPFCQEVSCFLSPPKNAAPIQAILCLQKMARYWLDFSQKPGTQTSLFSDPVNNLEQAYLLQVEENCRANVEALARYPQLPLGEMSLHNLLCELISGAQLSYTGNPETSLNIMGMLETRGLNFKHAVLLSLNEGILPSTPNPESFLLHGLRRYYNLPTQEEEAAMQAYHFYSLLQECSEVTLVYVNSAGDKAAEKSRFVLQLQHELPKQVRQLPSPAFNLMHEGFRSQSLTIEKTAPVLESIKDRLCGRGISFSSLFSYLQCPMQFYLQHVLQWEEPSQVQEEVDYGILGSVFHRAMQFFFEGTYEGGSNLLGKPLVQADIDLLRKHTPRLIQLALEKDFSGGEVQHGANLMACEKLKIFMERCASSLQEEISHAKLSVQSCEMYLRTVINDLLPGLNLCIIGFADRIDRYDAGDKEVLRIVDYKTGAVQEAFLDPSTWNELGEKDFRQALQLSLYIFLHRRMFPKEKRPLQACICGIKNHGKIFSLGDSLLLSHQNEQEYLERMEDFLRDFAKEILDPQIPLQCTGDEQTCQYCTFIQLCRNHAL